MSEISGSTLFCESRVEAQPGNLLNLKLSEIGWLLLANCLIFENAITGLIPVASYFDESATVLLAVCAIASLAGRRIESAPLLSVWERLGIVLLVLFAGVGFLSGYVSKVQIAMAPVLIDLFACVKFPVALISAYFVFRDGNRIYGLLVCESKILLLVMLPFAIANQFIDIGMRFDFRYGLYSFQFVFGHPSSLAVIVVGILVLFLAAKKVNACWLLLCWLQLVFTLRSTAIAFALFTFLLWLTSRNGKHIGCGQVVPFVLVAMWLGWSQFQYYFVTIDGSARRKLFDVGLQVADRFFPLGSGFATFGSNVTGKAEYYSSLYYQYGLSDVYGLSISNPSYLSDSFWPIVIGQFGWIGFILYLLVLALLFFGLVARLRTCNANILPVVAAFGYLLFSSVGSSAFFHPMSVFVAICIALSVNYILGTNRGE